MSLITGKSGHWHPCNQPLTRPLVIGVICAIQPGGGARQPSPTVTATICVEHALALVMVGCTHAAARPSPDGVSMLYGPPMFVAYSPLGLGSRALESIAPRHRQKVGLWRIGLASLAVGVTLVICSRSPARESRIAGGAGALSRSSRGCRLRTRPDLDPVPVAHLARDRHRAGAQAGSGGESQATVYG